MSIFEHDITSDILGDDLNRNIDDNDELPDTDDEQGQDNEQDINGEHGDGSQDKPKTVEPKKRAVKNPRHILKLETLKGPRGIHTIEKYFEGIQFRGKGYEKQDLNEVMGRLQHWAHRMFPTHSFDDVLAKVDKLGKKKELHVYMTRYRLGQLEGQMIDRVEDEAHDNVAVEEQNEPFDEFDALLDEQIAISKLAPKTPGSRSISSISSSVFHTPKLHENRATMSTPYPQNFEDLEELAQPLPLTPVSVSEQSSEKKATVKLSSEQMARIAENRRIAMERLKAKKEAEAASRKLKEIQLSAINESQDSF